jgi:rhodanese-related sulfurtransferase
MCHHGGRSAQVTGFLNAHGYPNAVNLDGGIDAWSTQIDPTVPRY